MLAAFGIAKISNISENDWTGLPDDITLKKFTCLLLTKIMTTPILELVT